MDPLGGVSRSAGRVARAAALAVLTALAGACSEPTFDLDSPPSQEAALEYLQSVVTVVQSGDITGICSLGGPTCRDSLQGIDPRTRPDTPPVVLGMRTLESSPNADGTRSGAGVVIELCGRDGLGNPYFSEMLVYFYRGRLVSTEPAFWIGLRIQTSPDVGGPTPSLPVCPDT